MYTHSYVPSTQDQACVHFDVTLICARAWHLFDANAPPACAVQLDGLFDSCGEPPIHHICGVGRGATSATVGGNSIGGAVPPYHLFRSLTMHRLARDLAIDLLSHLFTRWASQCRCGIRYRSTSCICICTILHACHS